MAFEGVGPGGGGGGGRDGEGDVGSPPGCHDAVDVLLRRVVYVVLQNSFIGLLFFPSQACVNPYVPRK